MVMQVMRMNPGGDVAGRLMSLRFESALTWPMHLAALLAVLLFSRQHRAQPRMKHPDLVRKMLTNGGAPRAGQGANGQF